MTSLSRACRLQEAEYTATGLIVSPSYKSGMPFLSDVGWNTEAPVTRVFKEWCQQSLTDQDKSDLMNAVPPAFVALDRQFHAAAGKLAHAAEAEDSQLQGFYFSEMLEGCVTCHAEFASDRFPGLGHEGFGADDH